MKRIFTIIGLSISISLGCSESPNDQPKVQVNGSSYQLSEEPEGAIGVISAREETKDQDEIVMVGRIGGRENPWIDGRAAFMVIDASMTVVEDGQESSETEVCLEDCCASERANCSTIVKVIDENGKPLSVDARELLGVADNDVVVIKGKVNRDEVQGTFAVVASGIYVRR